MSRYQAAGDLINRTAVSVGLNKVSDPFASVDPAFVQLCELANQVGEDLLDKYQWEVLNKVHEFMTAVGDPGDYDLPADFAYMIDQTGWQQQGPNGPYPLLGPATSQGWSFLEAMKIYNVTIFAYFWVNQNLLKLWPRPVQYEVPISFRYISNGWALADSTNGAPSQPLVNAFGNVVLYDPLLFIRGLKLAFLQAKGFDSTKAEDDFYLTFDSVTGHDKPAPILSMNRLGPGFRFLDVRNIPETGFGS
jgi:hypothetical protein